VIKINIQQLVKKLNPYSATALEAAAGACIQSGSYEITLEHWVCKLLENTQSDMALILNHFEIDIAKLRQSLLRSLERLPMGNTSKPVFSPHLFNLIQDAWLISSVELQETKIRSAALLLALCQEIDLFSGNHAFAVLSTLSKADVLKRLSKLFAKSCEQTLTEKNEDLSAARTVHGEQSALQQFCEDITEKARKGQLDPVFGRDNEIRQMIDILCRRRKNNPILVGEAGVGKTAIIEGLALKIVEGEVPQSLSTVSILCLDMALLEAGASVKGVFESRLKAVINEVKSSEKPVILFIDEAHTMIGAGGQEGHDAANLLKPALARGELRTIAATTWQEYKKHFEKDPALTRRFQLVKLDPPSAESTVMILRGLKARYEESHGVVIRDDAVVAAVELSTRYITGRQQPDKAVDLLDTCAARVQVNLSSKPAAVEACEQKMAAVTREQQALERDQLHGVVIDAEHYASCEQRLIILKDQLTMLNSRWQQERALIDALLQGREKFKSATKKEQATLHKQRTQLVKKLQKLQQPEPLLYFEVDPDAVGKVVSDWTGIPLGKVLRDEAAGLKLLPDQLRQRIKGQDQAIELVAERLKLAKAGLKAPNQPMGIFLLVGPSGVGKTETALTVADTLFGGEQSLVTINMSEFQEKHTISRLIGSPPGYVGYGEGGMLTEAVRQRPYSVVLLDEVEKASLDVLNLFYQVFDKGTLTDGEGREVDFSNTVIFLTSNLATDEITQLCHANKNIMLEGITEAVRPTLSRWFKPALLARTTVVPYRILNDQALSAIVKLKLDALSRRIHLQNRCQLHYTDAVLAQIGARCTEVETGARNIDHILRSTLMPKLAEVIIDNLSSKVMISAIRISVDASGKFEYAYD
jgi:type VI secretion system protein VasG